MRYINSDMLRHLFEVWKEIEEKAGNDKGVYCYNECINAIDKMHSDGVIEVEHGEWQEVKRWECTTHSVTDMRCSVCHHYASQVLPHQTTCTYDFCPNCGANMRGKK